jgi:hypothetical protein
MYLSQFLGSVTINTALGAAIVFGAEGRTSGAIIFLLVVCLFLYALIKEQDEYPESDKWRFRYGGIWK